MIALFNFKNCLFLLCFILGLGHAAAQSLNVLPVKLKADEITPVPYIFAENQQDLTNLKLASQTFPVVIIQNDVFLQVYNISKKRTDLIADLEKSKSLLEKNDGISEEQIKTLNELVATYKRQLDECDTLNARLNRSILTMNTNFESAVKIVDKNLKRDMLKKAGIGFLGASIGFTLATLLGAFR